MYAGVYRDEFLSEPALAALLAGMLELNDTIETPQDKKTFALDIFNGSLGFFNACYVALGMIKAKKASNAMIITAEIENNRELLPTMLLGLAETGSAMILDESPDARTGFGNFVFKYFTDYIDLCNTHSELYNGKMVLQIARDPDLEHYYVQCIRETVNELLSIEGLGMSQIKIVLPQQISSVFIDLLSCKMKVERSKFIAVGSERDLYTSALPYAFQYVQEQQLVQPGDIGLIINVGAGIQVGCATYYF
jgi:3-oxoacyl-[acyl-carrier-protein] synthase III